MPIHLINPMWDGSGGSEWRTISLFSLLAEETEVRIWSEYTPDRALAGKVPISEMMRLGAHPTSGTLVFVGCYFEIGRWISKAQPSRVILVYNVPAPHQLYARIAELQSYGVTNIEIVFSSELIASTVDLPGRVERSPIDLSRFEPSGETTEFIVGRHSRDVEDKFAPDELAFVASQPYSFRYLGGTILARQASAPQNLTILPNGTITPEAFLNSISCFFYRTHPAWTESYGRVVIEAMAAGLPCVLERRHGYAEIVEDGKTALLFDTAEEAKDCLLRLSTDSKVRAEIGKAARESILQQYRDTTRETVAYYLGSEA